MLKSSLAFQNCNIFKKQVSINSPPHLGDYLDWLENKTNTKHLDNYYGWVIFWIGHVLSYIYKKNNIGTTCRPWSLTFLEKTKYGPHVRLNCESFVFRIYTTIFKKHVLKIINNQIYFHIFLISKAKKNYFEELIINKHSLNYFVWFNLKK